MTNQQSQEKTPEIHIAQVKKAISVNINIALTMNASICRKNSIVVCWALPSFLVTTQLYTKSKFSGIVVKNKETKYFQAYKVD